MLILYTLDPKFCNVQFRVYACTFLTQDKNMICFVFVYLIETLHPYFVYISDILLPCRERERVPIKKTEDLSYSYIYFQTDTLQETLNHDLQISISQESQSTSKRCRDARVALEHNARTFAMALPPSAPESTP